jgi:hypothetical protein
VTGTDEVTSAGPALLIDFVIDYALVISLPLLIVLTWTIIDIWRRPGVTRRGLWTVGCCLFWPTMVAYFAVRPLAEGGNRRLTGSQGDPRAKLVLAIIDPASGYRVGDLRPPS